MSEQLNNTYDAFYKGEKVRVDAFTSYGAQKEAAKLLKAKNVYDVTVVLVKLGSHGEVPFDHCSLPGV